MNSTITHKKKQEAETPSYKSVLQPLTIVYYSYHMLSSKSAPVILLTKLSKVWGTTLTIDSDPSSAFPWPEMSNLRPTTMKQPNIYIYIIYIHIYYIFLIEYRFPNNLHSSMVAKKIDINITISLFGERSQLASPE